MSIARLVESFCEEQGLEYRENYSGRYMFGKQCIGIVTDGNMLETMVSLSDYLHECGIENVSAQLSKISWDNMGLDMIIYFPSISYK